MRAHYIAFVPLVASFHWGKSFNLNEENTFASNHLGQFFNLNQDLVSLSMRAAQLSQDVYGNTTGVPGAISFTDEPDKALFVKEDNVCWAVFRGTMLNARDWIENFKFIPKTSCTQSSKQCCKTHRGFSNAYFGPSYRDELESLVLNCKATCPNCEVVFTGHSQGGAIASIAAIAMHDYDLDPTIITFGQAASTIGPCPPINVNKYYRYVNTLFNDRTREFDYDPVPFVDVYVDKLGQLLLLGDDKKNVARYENDDGPSVGFVTEWRIPAHFIAQYVSRLMSLLGSGSFPIGADGWDTGYGCDEDPQCASPGKCIKHRCTTPRDAGDQWDVLEE